MARDGTWSPYKAGGLALWAIVLLIELIMFGAGGLVLGLIQSLTTNVSDNIAKTFGDSAEEMKLQSYTTMVSAFIALVTSILHIWFEVFVSTEGVARSAAELMGLYSIFAAAILVVRPKPETV
jgi:hypothetical protein